MKVLITGANGQLGRELLFTCPGDCQVIGRDKTQLDISDADAVNEQLQRLQPEFIINAAAYTAVDAMQQNPALAQAVNAQGVKNLALAARSIPARMLQVSTDFVFSGRRSTPYTSSCTPDPINVYGQSKWAGERLALDILPTTCTVLRTSWLYSQHGGNFVKTMLRLMSRGEAPGVVCDQIGTPTWCRDLARVIWKIVATENFSGVHHWTNAGVASWYDFSVAIQEEAVQLELLPPSLPPVKPLNSDQYPTPATRPHYSVLDKSSTWASLGEIAPHWRSGLRNMLAELTNA
jgi:dTDP-4-dehydrorhamnose reductase